jgi:hypothetical protein
VRIQRVVLKHHRNIRIARCEIVDDVLADPDDALADVLEPSDHSQRRRLTRAGRTNQNHELPIRNHEAHVPDRLHTIGVAFGHLFKNYARRTNPFSHATRRLPRTPAKHRPRQTRPLKRLRLTRDILNHSVPPHAPGSTARHDRRIVTDDQTRLVRIPVANTQHY